MAEKGDAHGGASLPFNSSPFTTSAGDAAAEVPVAKAPAPKAETPVAKAPVMKAEAHVAKAPAPKAETPVTNVPAQKAEAAVAKAPVTKAEAPVANVPAQKAETLVANVPAQKSETHVAKAPVQKAETPVANVPAQKVETPVAKAPSQKAETPVANVPTQKAETPVAKAPAQKVETPVAQAPAQKAETMSRQLPAVLIPSRDPGALLSGGGISFLTGNGTARFSYGYSTFKGKRSSMEDFFETSISEVDGQMVAFFGVFDGHGGSRTAEYLKNNLFKNLCSHPGFIKDTKSAIVEAFQQTDADYLKEEKGQQKDAGSTASTAVLVGDRLLVANVGDSRVVACRAGSAIPLSIDHKPDRSDERERIEQAGGFVMWAGTWRVGGVLAVSRAFGDKLLKPYVVAEPEIQEEEIDGVDFIIIASDGLWNVLSNKDAVALVENIQDAEAASRKLIEEAYAKGSSDNITCVVVRFEDSSSSTA